MAIDVPQRNCGLRAATFPIKLGSIPSGVVGPENRRSYAPLTQSFFLTLRFPTDLYVEGPKRTDRNDEDASENHHQVTNAKQTQTRLIGQKCEPRCSRCSSPHCAGGMNCRRYSDDGHRSGVGGRYQAIQQQAKQHEHDARMSPPRPDGAKHQP